MKRRNFLKLFGLALVAPKAVVSVFKKPAAILEPRVWDALTDDTAWFLSPQKGDDKVIFYDYADSIPRVLKIDRTHYIGKGVRK